MLDNCAVFTNLRPGTGVGPVVEDEGTGRGSWNGNTPKEESSMIGDEKGRACRENGR